MFTDKPVDSQFVDEVAPEFVLAVVLKNVYGVVLESPAPASEAPDMVAVMDVAEGERETLPGVGLVRSFLNATDPPFAVEYDDIALESSIVLTRQ